MTLRTIAHARTGDKGETCNISVIAFDARDYPTPRRTGDGRARHGALRATSCTARSSATNCPISARLNFVLTRALGGGVTRSLALDAHGKSLSALLLTLEI